jgi:hypothetical protein
VVTYGAEVWTLNKDFAKGLAVFERKILRRIFGAIKVNENWRKRHNKGTKAGVWRFRYTVICQNKSAQMDWSC